MSERVTASLCTGLACFPFGFVSVAPFAHRPGSDWGENNQSDTRNDMTLLTLQRFQSLMIFFVGLSPLPAEAGSCLPAEMVNSLVDPQDAKHGQDSGTDVCRIIHMGIQSQSSKEDEEPTA